MSVTVTGPGDREESVFEPPAFPHRPVPAGLPRRVRRRAFHRRAGHVLVSFTLAGVAVGTLLLAGASRPDGSVPGPLPDETAPPVPWPGDRDGADDDAPPPARVEVGAGAVAWLSGSGADGDPVWCVGTPPVPGEPTVIHSCRALPGDGLDVVALDPDAFAPAGRRLVVAALAEPPTRPVHTAVLTDADGVRTMRVNRAPGSFGPAYVWGFSEKGPVSLTIRDQSGAVLAECADCVEPPP